MAILEIDGLRIAYDEQGKDTTGGTVVLLHGFPFNRTMWEPQIDALRGAYHIIAPDMRGHGSSEISEGAVSMERMADDVHALVTARDAAPIVLVGLSMGGYVALQFVRKYPELLRGLVLADTRATADTDEIRSARREMIKTVAGEGASAVAQSMLPKLLSKRTVDEEPELVVKVRRMIETTSAAGIAAALAGMAERPDSTEMLAEIAVPTLILVGSDDVITPPAEAEAMHERVATSRLVVIEGAGHLSNLEQDEAFSKALKDFLAGLRPAPAGEREPEAEPEPAS